MSTAPDYKAMYYALFRASAQAAQLLEAAQAAAEEELLRAAPPPLHLREDAEDDTPGS